MPASGRTTRVLAATLAGALVFAPLVTPLRAAWAAPGKAPAKKGATAAKSAEQVKREEEAYALFEESEQRYREGEFLQAAELLRLAYKLDPEPTLLFNLGRALESAADLEGAAAAYRAYVDAAPKADDRVQTERRIENLERQINEKRALEQAREEEAKKREALERAVRERQGAGGSSTQLAGGGTLETAAPAVEERSRTLPIVTLGLGGAAAVTGAVLAVLAVQKRDDATNEPVQRSAAILADDAHALEVGAVVGWVAGGALLAGGLGWLLLGSGDDGVTPRATVSVRPSSVVLDGRF